MTAQKKPEKIALAEAAMLVVVLVVSYTYVESAPLACACVSEAWNSVDQPPVNCTHAVQHHCSFELPPGPCSLTPYMRSSA
jgi:hypothetical protein